jgi:hypothetical protein
LWQIYSSLCILFVSRILALLLLLRLSSTISPVVYNEFPCQINKIRLVRTRNNVCILNLLAMLWKMFDVNWKSSNSSFPHKHYIYSHFYSIISHPAHNNLHLHTTCNKFVRTIFTTCYLKMSEVCSATKYSCYIKGKKYTEE